MSAGTHGEYPGEPAITVISSLDGLAPGFRRRVVPGLAECHAEGLDAIVHESIRTRATALVYYRRGRSTIPPHAKVTNAPNELYSWHGYGLAVDVISKSKGWDAGDVWFKMMAAIFEKHGCAWGGRWRRPDMPHIQMGGMKDSPSDHAREIFVQGGMQAVWRAVGADA